MHDARTVTPYTARSFESVRFLTVFLARMALPNVIMPTRPIYISNISTTLLSTQISVRMPEDKPAVANADA